MLSTHEYPYKVIVSLAMFVYTLQGAKEGATKHSFGENDNMYIAIGQDSRFFYGERWRFFILQVCVTLAASFLLLAIGPHLSEEVRYGDVTSNNC